MTAWGSDRIGRHRTVFARLPGTIRVSIVVKLHGRYARLSRTGQRDLFVMSLSLLPLQAEGNSPFFHTRPVSSHRGYFRLLLPLVRINGGHSRLYLTPLALFLGALNTCLSPSCLSTPCSSHFGTQHLPRLGIYINATVSFSVRIPTCFCQFCP